MDIGIIALRNLVNRTNSENATYSSTTARLPPFTDKALLTTRSRAALGSSRKRQLLSRLKLTMVFALKLRSVTTAMAIRPRSRGRPRKTTVRLRVRLSETMPQRKAYPEHRCSERPSYKVDKRLTIEEAVCSSNQAGDALQRHFLHG